MYATGLLLTIKMHIVATTMVVHWKPIWAPNQPPAMGPTNCLKEVKIIVSRPIFARFCLLLDFLDTALINSLLPLYGYLHYRTLLTIVSYISPILKKFSRSAKIRK